MGKKGSSKKTPNAISGSQPKSMLKLEHLKKLAVWFSEEASIPSLAAFFGHHLAIFTEALGAPSDPSLFTCQRCESILQQGNNCTIRIEKNGRDVRSRRKKSTPGPQNNVVYNCHFCSHQNLLRGIQKGHMKDICPPKLKKSTAQKSEISIRQESSKVKPHKSKSRVKHHVDYIEITKMDEVASSEILKDDSVSNGPTTPSVAPTLTLLDAKMKTRKRSSSKKTFSSESVSAVADEGNVVSSSNKRRRKSWTSLKEIAESSGNDGGRKLRNLTIPFSL